MYTWGYIKENTLAKLNMTEKEANNQEFLSRFPYYANEAMTQICSSVFAKEDFFTIKVEEAEMVTMPDDFISFSADVPYYNGKRAYREEFDYVGYNRVYCKKAGTYIIPYHARWFFFTKDLDNDVQITAPADVCDAIPSYIASQCLKIDDEAKAAIYRNEYEIFLARIDDTSYKAQRTFHIGGGW